MSLLLSKMNTFNKFTCKVITSGDVEELKYHLNTKFGTYKNVLSDKWYVYAAIDSGETMMVDFLLKTISKKLLEYFYEFPDILFFMTDSHDDEIIKDFVGVFMKHNINRPKVADIESPTIKIYDYIKNEENKNRVFEVAKCAKNLGKYDCVNSDVCEKIFSFL